jgi:AraC family transcriptional regulator
VFGGSIEDAQSGGDVRRRSAGELAFRPGPVTHRTRALSRGARFLTIDVDDRVLDEFDILGLSVRIPVESSSDRAIHLAHRVDVALSARDAASSVEAAGLAHELLALAIRRVQPSPEPPAWLLDVRDRLATGRPGAAGVEALARGAGVTVSKLGRQFRRYFGTSIGEHVRQMKVATAIKLLNETELSLAVVALRAGFCDQSHLTNVLRRRAGFTPAAYRRHLGAAE